MESPSSTAETPVTPSITSSRLVDIGAGLLAIGAGAYLLLHHSPPVTVAGQTGESWLAVLAHAIGVYFIARGLVWVRNAGYLADIADAVKALARNSETAPPHANAGRGQF